MKKPYTQITIKTNEANGCKIEIKIYEHIVELNKFMSEIIRPALLAYGYDEKNVDEYIADV